MRALIIVGVFSVLLAVLAAISTVSKMQTKTNELVSCELQVTKLEANNNMLLENNKILKRQKQVLLDELEVFAPKLKEKFPQQP